MKDFARIVDGGDLGQILMIADTNDYDKPVLEFKFSPSITELGICSTSLVFDDDESGYTARDKTFSAMSDESAIGVVRTVVDQMVLAFGEDAK